MSERQGVEIDWIDRDYGKHPPYHRKKKGFLGDFFDFD